jgi:hypothetical protein
MTMHGITRRAAPFAAGIFLLIPGTLAAGGLTGQITAGDFPLKGNDRPPIIWIEGAPADGVPAVDTEITHRGGELSPPVSIAYVGREFVFRNDDPEFHNTHLYLHLDYQRRASQRPLHYGATLYNVPLPVKGTEIRRPVKAYHRIREETGFIEVVCNPHPDERAYVLVFDHPYCTIAGDDGSYTIRDVPPGRYPVWAFHRGTLRKLADAEIGPDGTTRLDLNME